MNEKVNPQDFMEAFRAALAKGNIVLENPNATAVQYAETLSDLVEAGEVFYDWYFAKEDEPKPTEQHWSAAAWDVFDELETPDDKETPF